MSLRKFFSRLLRGPGYPPLKFRESMPFVHSIRGRALVYGLRAEFQEKELEMLRLKHGLES